MRWPWSSAPDPAELGRAILTGPSSSPLGPPPGNNLEARIQKLDSALTVPLWKAFRGWQKAGMGFVFSPLRRRCTSPQDLSNRTTLSMCTTMKTRFPLLLLSLLAWSAPTSHADLITGQVVDSNGVGVPGVDIDVKNLGSGGDPAIFNDGTDVNGFFSTTLPAGFYRVTFNPPPPPASTHLILEVDNVVVVGTTNMGVLSLPPGVALTGSAVNSSGFPIGGINLDVIDNVTGDNINLVGGTTNAFGQFSIAVPPNSIEVRFDTTPVMTQTLASQSVDLSPTVDTSLGTLTFEPGWRLTGNVVNSSGLPVSNADFDVIDLVTKSKLFTPKDNTDAAGLFSVVVPAGTFDVEVCPPNGSTLVCQGVFNLPVSADTPLGTIVMPQGVALFGTIRGFDGLPIQGADVDVTDSLTGIPVVLTGDNADASGAYSVLIPTGTFDIQFEPPGFALPYGAQEILSATFTGATLLDGTLPTCPFALNYGAGSPGTGGIVPHITSSGGAPRTDNNAWAIELESGRGGAMAVLMIGLGGPSSIPFSGGTILVNILDPSLQLIGVPLSGTPGAAGAGSGTFAFPVPPTVSGISAWCQFGVLDPGIPFIVALSDGLSVTFCN